MYQVKVRAQGVLCINQFCPYHDLQELLKRGQKTWRTTPHDQKRELLDYQKAKVYTLVSKVYYFKPKE